jgi:hypothetical protein
MKIGLRNYLYEQRPFMLGLSTEGEALYAMKAVYFQSSSPAFLEAYIQQ